MRIPSLEEIAESWTLAHTVAVAAWVVVVILGVVLFTRHVSDGYSATDELKVYAGENLTFTYPENWTINNCIPGKPFIELPGTIKADYKGRQAYPFTMYGVTTYECMKGKPERFDIYSEDIVASETPCIPATSTRGGRLQNGLYLQLQEEDGQVVAISIKQNSCFAPPDALMLAFSFADPEADPEVTETFETPRVKREAFLASRQYQDIRALAESIRY